MRSDLWNILEPIAVDPSRKSWKDVLRCLVYHANGSGEAWPSIETIRRECGYKSHKAIIDALAGLKGLGIIYPMKGSPIGGGRARPTKWLLSHLLNGVDNLVDNSTIEKRDTKSKSEVSSQFSENGEVTSQKGEATSVKGEATSHRIIKNKKEVSKLVSTSRNHEPTSRLSITPEKPTKVKPDHSAEELLTPHGDKPLQVAPSARNDAAGGVGPKPMKVEDIFPNLQSFEKPIDYFQLCSELGWKPNDAATVPNKAALEQARRAVVACAYREGLSEDEAKKFLRWNIGRKWSGIDRSSCVKDLAKLWLEKWKKSSFDDWLDERDRRARQKRLREEERMRKIVEEENRRAQAENRPFS